MTPDEAAALLYSLDEAVYFNGGRVPLAWVLQHAPAGDPVAEAWAVCAAPTALLNLAWSVLGESARLGANDALHSECSQRTGGCPNSDREACGDADCPPCANAIRAVVPALTLADVLEGARRG